MKDITVGRKIIGRIDPDDYCISLVLECGHVERVRKLNEDSNEIGKFWPCEWCTKNDTERAYKDQRDNVMERARYHDRTYYNKADTVTATFSPPGTNAEIFESGYERGYSNGYISGKAKALTMMNKVLKDRTTEIFSAVVDRLDKEEQENKKG